MPETNYDFVRRTVRTIKLVSAFEQAGIAPVPVLPLHAFAYLADLLAPVWRLQGTVSTVLKKTSGPFFPTLQAELDVLVGRGVMAIHSMRFIEVALGAWRLDGAYSVNHSFADRILAISSEFDDEKILDPFLNELALALATLNGQELAEAATSDFTYANPAVGPGNILEYGGKQSTNASIVAIQRFDQFAPEGLVLTPGERLHLYIRFLREQLVVPNAGREQ